MSVATIENGKRINQIEEVDILTDDSIFLLSKDTLTRTVTLKSIRQAFNGDVSTDNKDNKYYSVNKIDEKFNLVNTQIGNLSTLFTTNNTSVNAAINQNTNSISLIRNELTRIENESKKRDTDLSSNLGNFGTIVHYDAVEPGTGDTYGKAPVVSNSGVMEIGKYLDFHAKDNDTDDYTIRLGASGTIDNSPVLTMSEATLVLPNSNQISGTAYNYPALLIGGLSNTIHLEVDSTTIQAKADTSNTSTLHLNRNGGAVEIGKGGLTSSGTVTVKKGLNVLQGTNLNGDVIVASGKTTTLGGALNVSGNSQLSGKLTVTNSTSLQDLTVASGQATILGGLLVVNGTSSFNNDLKVSAGKPTILGGDLTVEGTSTFNESVTVAEGKTTTLGGAVTINGATHANGNIQVAGNLVVTAPNNSMSATYSPTGIQTTVTSSGNYPPLSLNGSGGAVNIGSGGVHSYGPISTSASRLITIGHAAAKTDHLNNDLSWTLEDLGISIGETVPSTLAAGCIFLQYFD